MKRTSRSVWCPLCRREAGMPCGDLKLNTATLTPAIWSGARKIAHKDRTARMYRVLDVVRNLGRAGITCSIEQADVQGSFDWEEAERWASIVAALRQDPNRKLDVPPKPKWVERLTRVS